jgi:Ni,Fe-hydrogenase maturation factor
LVAADRAIFLDAHPAGDDPAVRVRPITAVPRTNRFGHSSDPRALLAFTKTAFGRSPEAWWVTIPAADFALGAPLSRFTERGIADALAAIRPLLDLSVPDTQVAIDGMRSNRRDTGCPTR